MMPPKIVPTQQSLSLVHTSVNGSELWLGDYSAATDVGILRRRAIKSGTRMAIQSSLPHHSYRSIQQNCK